MNRSAENGKNGQKCENSVIANDAKIPHNKEKATKNSCPTGVDAGQRREFPI